MNPVLCFIISYLVGCIHPAAIIAHAKGFDIRTRGTHNPGGTNAILTMGKKVGIGVILIDGFKAFFAVRIPLYVFKYSIELCALSGICCLIGHVFPVQMKGRGGKGTASLFGIILGLTPWIFAPLLVVLLFIGLFTDNANLLPMITVTAYPTVFYILKGSLFATVLLAALIPLFYWKHRKNLQEHHKGNEEHSFREIMLSGRHK